MLQAGHPGRRRSNYVAVIEVVISESLSETPEGSRRSLYVLDRSARIEALWR
jgi:hypothetical protein